MTEATNFCPLCGAGQTHHAGPFKAQSCLNDECGLSCRLWERVAALTKVKDKAIPTERAKRQWHDDRLFVATHLLAKATPYAGIWTAPVIAESIRAADALIAELARTEEK